jgi:hypothetical protein
MGSYSSDVKAKLITASDTDLGAGRTRIRQLQVVTAGSGSPQITVKSGGSSGTTVLDLKFSTSITTSVNIPADGILSEEDPNFTLTNITSVTVFYA